jgi:Kef-type K+ transport system membrane component KefB
MTNAWHRLGVYLDLREDLVAEARRESGRPRHRAGRIAKSVLEVALAIAAFIVFFCVLALIVHLISGDTSTRGVLVDGLRFFAWALTAAMVVFFLGRWLYWFADRWVRKG